MGDSDPITRGSAIAALVRLKAATAADLATASADPDPSVRQRALRLLTVADAQQPPGLDLEELLVAHLPDPDDGVTEVAAFTAGELFAPPAPVPAPVLEALSAIATTHDDALCRESAVAALGAIGHPDGLAAVLAGCRDRATVRRRAVLALAAFDGPEVDATLDRLLNDRDLQVRQAAEDLR
jgi:HEAT repeat protein